MLTEHVEIQTRHSLDPQSDSSCEGTLKSVAYLPEKKLITSNRCFNLWLVAKSLPQNRNREYDKNARETRDFKEPRSIGLRDTFCRLKHS